jgi:hypothetical protein
MEEDVIEKITEQDKEEFQTEFTQEDELFEAKNINEKRDVGFIETSAMKNQIEGQISEEQNEESSSEDEQGPEVDDKGYSPQIYPTSKTLMRQSRVMTAAKKHREIEEDEGIKNYNSLSHQIQYSFSFKYNHHRIPDNMTESGVRIE